MCRDIIVIDCIDLFLDSYVVLLFFFFSSRRRHTRCSRDWSSDVCSSDLFSVTPKTVVRGSFGLFYDHFRLGLVRDIPGFGGADIREIQPLSFPRLFYGVPTIAPDLFGVCQSTSMTDAQVASSGATCPFPGF